MAGPLCQWRAGSCLGGQVEGSRCFYAVCEALKRPQPDMAALRLADEVGHPMHRLAFGAGLEAVYFGFP